MKTLKNLLIKSYSAMIFSLVIALCTIVVNPGTQVNAATNERAQRYGLTIDDAVYNLDTWFDNPSIGYVYNSSGILLGSYSIIAARARCKTTYNGYYMDTVLLRVEMEPTTTKKGSTYYHGINQQAEAIFSLSSNQNYVNYAPKSDPPTGTETWNFSFGGNASTSNGGTYGISANIGYSTTTHLNAFFISHNYSSVSKQYKISYDYQPSAAFFSNQTKRNINKWLHNNHQAFFAYSFNTPISSDYSNFLINYKVNFRQAHNSQSKWDGGTWDVVVNTAGNTQYRDINYRLY